MKISKSFKIYIHIILALLFTSYLHANPDLSKNLVVHDKPLDILELKFKDINLQEVDLTKNKGNIMIINFWASWCSPCRLEHKYLIALKKDFNLKILGINFKDNKNNAIKYLSEYGNPYYFVAKDFEGKSSVQFGTYGIPESILIDKNLTIIKKYIGPLNDENFNEIIEAIKN